MNRTLGILAFGVAVVAGWTLMDSWSGGRALNDQESREFDTEEYRIRVTSVASLDTPWSVAFLPNGDMLVTEKIAGRLRLIKSGLLQPEPIEGVPEVHARGQGGLFDVVLHPRFADNGVVYLTYAKQVDGGNSGPMTTTAVLRATFDGTRLVEPRDIFVAKALDPGSGHFGARLVFDRDGMMYLTVGDRQGVPKRAQDTLDHAGKILRLRDDGTVPETNPFFTQAGYLPEIYSLGHRNLQGLVIHPETGEMFETEHGPLGGDELNRILPGRNYGWPVITYGKNYDGSIITNETSRTGMEQPLVYWVPSIAPSGLTVYVGDKFARWRGNFFVGAMADRIEGEQLVRVAYDAVTGKSHQEFLLRDLRQRIRDVRTGPDGLLYVLTDEVDGALLRIEPTN